MKDQRLKFLKFNANELTREQMKNVSGGVANAACYQCCTGDLSLCGHCGTNGSGGCQGHGVAWPCFCIAN